MKNLDKPNSEATRTRHWLDVRLLAPLAEERRRLGRVLRKAGALRIWQDEREVRSLWPDDDQSNLALKSALLGLPENAAQIRRFTAHNPNDAWLEPGLAEIAPGLKLAPAWMGLEPNDEVLVIDALTAFGAGDHPSTTINLFLLAKAIIALGPLNKQWLADVGTGTGILALAMALKTGCPIAAVDPDPASARAVARNRRLNPQLAGLVHFVLGTHRCLKGKFPLVAANLPGPILLQAGQGLADMTAPGGWLVTSGFRPEFGEKVRGFFLGRGLTSAHSRQKQGWQGLAFVRQ